MREEKRGNKEEEASDGRTERGWKVGGTKEKEDGGG